MLNAFDALQVKFLLTKCINEINYKLNSDNIFHIQNKEKYKQTITDCFILLDYYNKTNKKINNTTDLDNFLNIVGNYYINEYFENELYILENEILHHYSD